METKRVLSHLWSSLYHSKAAGGTAMASQRKMVVLPKWTGMFFMSVIMGGSGRTREGENNGETEGGRQQLVYICLHREVKSGQHRVDNPPVRATLRCISSYIMMKLTY